jgi:hypothetical protein
MLNSQLLNLSHNMYFGSRDKFYYVELSNTQIRRDNTISELFGEKPQKKYFSLTTPTKDIFLAKFWKDKHAVEIFTRGRIDSTIYELSREDFITLIPDPDSVGDWSKDARYEKNLLAKRKEINYQNKWQDFRKKYYKCIPAYIKVKNPNQWSPCTKCCLIPLVWEFNNGRSTACGCGENEYQHFSIWSESIMSYVKRNGGSALDYDSDKLRKNWNHWCRTGIELEPREQLLKEGKW